MFVPKPLKKWLRLFRGDVAPVLVLLSVMLGVWFGMMPTFSGLHVVLLAVVLLLNVHLGLFLIGTAGGAALMLAAAPVLYYVGQWSVARSFAAILAELPVIGITDFSRYAVVGGLLLGPLVGLVLGGLLAWSVHVFRKSWVRLEDKSEALKKFQSAAWVRWLEWLLIGKRADTREVLKRKPRYVRIPGLVVAAVLLLAVGVGAWLLRNDLLTDRTAQALTQANGAEVNLESVRCDLFGGRFTVDGLQMTDPAEPHRNRLEVANFTADVAMWDLLCGRIVLDAVTLNDVGFDTTRARPGRVLTPPPGDEAVAAAAEEAEFSPTRYKLPTIRATPAELRDYFRESVEVRDKVVRFASHLPAAKKKPDVPRALEPPPAPESYIGYLTARAPSAPAPRVLVRHLSVDPVQFQNPQFGKARVEAENLNDAWNQAVGIPVRIQITSHDTAARLELELDRPDRSGGLLVTGRFEGVDLKQLQQSGLSPRNPVLLEQGTAGIEFDGVVSASGLNLTGRATARELSLTPGPKPPFNLDRKTASEALALITEADLTLRLVGPPAAPRLVFDQPALEALLRERLTEAGKAAVLSRLDAALQEQFGDQAPDAGQLGKDPVGSAKGALSGLLGGKNDNKSENDNANNTNENAAEDDNPLRKLLDP